MKQQTYIIVLEDTNGRTINFERFTYKRAKTCIGKMISFYRTTINYSFVCKELARTTRLVCYPTPDGYNRSSPVWSVTADEFQALLEEVSA